MTGDAEREHLAEMLAVPVYRHLGAGGGVIDTPPARKPILKFLRVLAEVVQQAGHPADVGTAHRVEKVRGARTRADQVLRQPVPMLPLFRGAAVGVVLRANHSDSLVSHTASISFPFPFVPFAMRFDTMPGFDQPERDGVRGRAAAQVIRVEPGRSAPGQGVWVCSAISRWKRWMFPSNAGDRRPPSNAVVANASCNPSTIAMSSRLKD